MIAFETERLRVPTLFVTMINMTIVYIKEFYSLDRKMEFHLEIKYISYITKLQYFTPYIQYSFIYYSQFLFGYFIYSFNSSDNVISTTETSIKPSEPTQQSQQRLEPTYSQEAQEYAAEQPILYVTPPTGGKDDGSNSEINTRHTEAATIMHANINPVFTVDNEQQQSDAYDMPAASTLAEPSPALQEYASTGRAIDYHRPAYNFNQLMTPLIKNPPLPAPAVREKPVTSNIGKIIYPQAFNQRRPPNEAEINKLSGKGKYIAWIYRSREVENCLL